MTTRHTVEPDDQRVPVAATAQRRGAMYMRAEARRAAELGGVATTAAPKKRGVPRRIQLAAFAAVWLLVAGVTAVVGIRWAREDRTPPVPTRAAATSASVPPARSSTVAESTAVPRPNPVPVSARNPAATADRAATPISAVAASKPAFTPKPIETVNRVPARTREAVSTDAARSNGAVTRARPTATRSAPAARLVVTSSPAGAVITVDGIGWGATPAKIGYLPPGTKHVRVTKDGYASQETTIRVGDSGTTTLNVQLRPTGR
jgi:hypothetical protein